MGRFWFLQSNIVADVLCGDQSIFHPQNTLFRLRRARILPHNNILSSTLSHFAHSKNEQEEYSAIYNIERHRGGQYTSEAKGKKLRPQAIAKVRGRIFCQPPVVYDSEGKCSE